MKNYLLKICATVFVILLATTIMAQEKTDLKSFTLEDLIPGGTTYSKMRPESKSYHFEGDRCVEGRLEEKEGLPYKAHLVDNNIFVTYPDGTDLRTI